MSLHLFEHGERRGVGFGGRGAELAREPGDLRLQLRQHLFFPRGGGDRVDLGGELQYLRFERVDARRIAPGQRLDPVHQQLDLRL